MKCKHQRFARLDFWSPCQFLSTSREPTAMLEPVDADEQDVCNYLKQWPKQFISGREIARRAGGKRRARQDPFWANPVLLRMVEKQLLETDRSGHFRLVQKAKKTEPKKWISPEIQKMLDESGKKIEGVIEVDDREEPSP